MHLIVVDNQYGLYRIGGLSLGVLLQQKENSNKINAE